ncbi:MAG: UDP-N-acetylmuramoyl-L-alanine--D-glutamate ligase [Stellaceae bacterium]
MRAAELGARRVAIWGLAREGRATVGLLRKIHPQLPLMVLDDDANARAPEGFGDGIEWVFGADRIAGALLKADVLVKSPGVSLYRREIQSARQRGLEVTSLLNLWFAERPTLKTICVTGTKGKSTTSSLIAHMLKVLGRQVALAGNIGVPITEINGGSADYAVIEVSSHQAADFDGSCEAAVLTSLYPEHIDWHVTVENYFRDKINLIDRGRRRIVNREAAGLVAELTGGLPSCTYQFNDEEAIHHRDGEIFDGGRLLGRVSNRYLARPHNASNLCAALATLRSFEIDPAAALETVGGFQGLPHRQQELGTVEGLLFVDDSISTIPESTLAALAVYTGRQITVIVGGYDRGIDYSKLVETVSQGTARTLICLGDSGHRICALARAAAATRSDFNCAILESRSMGDAVSLAKRVTPSGGVVLLSPAAPSYGSYQDYIERGRDFAAQAGLLPAPEDGSHSDAE